MSFDPRKEFAERLRCKGANIPKRAQEKYFDFWLRDSNVTSSQMDTLDVDDCVETTYHWHEIITEIAPTFGVGPQVAQIDRVREIAPHRKPPKKGYAVVKHIGQGWWKETRTGTGWISFDIPSRLPWPEITAKWNEKHPDDTMRLASLQREYYRYRDLVLKHVSINWICRAPIEELRDMAKRYRAKADASCLDLSDPEQRAFLDKMRPLIDAWEEQAANIDKMIALRETRESQRTGTPSL